MNGMRADGSCIGSCDGCFKKDLVIRKATYASLEVKMLCRSCMHEIISVSIVKRIPRHRLSGSAHGILGRRETNKKKWRELKKNNGTRKL